MNKIANSKKSNASLTMPAHVQLGVIIRITILALGVAGMALLTSSIQGQSSNAIYLPAQISEPTGFYATPVGENFNVVTAITDVGDDRLFIGEQAGRIKILHPDGRITTFLDISNHVISNRGEYGFFDVDFEPGYADPTSPGYGYFFVSYTTGYDIDFDHRDVHTIVSRFRVSADPDVADPGSEVVYFKYPQAFDVHKGGGMDFDKISGMLFVGIGEDRQGEEALNNTSPTGKIIRLDPSDPQAKYEIWAFGLRNPWRLDVDEVSSQIYLGDVGDALYEEVNLVPLALAGFNYGWPCMEGPYRDPYVNEIVDLPACRRQFDAPIHYYQHRDGSGRCAVIGGFVFRPEYNPSDNRYIFGDMCTREIFSLDKDTGDWQRTTLARLDNVDLLGTFGEDRFGNLYLGTLSSNSPVYRLHIP